jgi:hypothetical protein
MIRTLLIANAVLSVMMGNPPESTVVRGRIVSAIAREPIAGVVVKVGSDSTFTDQTGAYALRASRASDWLGVRKAGWLDFQLPLLELSSDTLYANVELRSDPPSAASYLGQPALPYLCVRMDDGAHLDVTNSCQWETHPEAEYVRKIIKHNPWSPYFGRAGDHGGIMLATRLR